MHMCVTHVRAVLCLLHVCKCVSAILHREAIHVYDHHIEKDLEDNAWQNYGRAFRRQAASTKSLEWAMIDPTPYSIALTGYSNTERGVVSAPVRITAELAIQLNYSSTHGNGCASSQHYYKHERVIGEKCRLTKHNEIC